MFLFPQFQNSLQKFISCKQIFCVFFKTASLTVYIFPLSKLSIHLILNSFGRKQ